MTNEKPDGGPAFPALEDAYLADKGMSLRQYAAIKLRVPDSGVDWLDDMIRKSLRDQFAGQALVGWLAGADGDENFDTADYRIAADDSYRMADAMLKARTK